MKIIERIQQKYELLISNKKLKDKPTLIVLHPATKRKIFTEQELEKNLDLSEYLGLKVILSKEIKEDETIIGV